MTHILPKLSLNWLVALPRSDLFPFPSWPRVHLSAPKPMRVGRERRALLVTQNTLLILSARQLSDASASGFVCLWCLHFTTRWTDGSANDKRHANTSVEGEGNKEEKEEGPARFRARSRQSIVSTWLRLAGRMCNIKSNYFLCNMVTAWGRRGGREGRRR